MNAGTASLHQTGTMTRKREQTAAAPVCYATLLWLFVIGSAVGFVLEGLWCVLRTGRWESHSATIWGPFCIIYGVGAVAVYLLSAFLKNRGVLLQFAVRLRVRLGLYGGEPPRHGGRRHPVAVENGRRGARERRCAVAGRGV